MSNMSMSDVSNNDLSKNKKNGPVVLKHGQHRYEIYAKTKLEMLYLNHDKTRQQRFFEFAELACTESTRQHVEKFNPQITQQTLQKNVFAPNEYSNIFVMAFLEGQRLRTVDTLPTAEAGGF